MIMARNGTQGLYTLSAVMYPAETRMHSGRNLIDPPNFAPVYVRTRPIKFLLIEQSSLSLADTWKSPKAVPVPKWWEHGQDD